jgi:hypothetical protein
VEPLKTSSFQLPNNETVEIVMVRDSSGRIVPRRRDELVTLPSPPSPSTLSDPRR